MIIVRTPLRVSFFGGGTDHPSWFKHHGPGAVLSTSIDKYVYITLRYLPKVFDFRYRVSWRIVEQTQTIDEIQHPVVREVLRHYAPPGEVGYEIAYNADLPARSGLGSSSAFTVAALHALMQHEGKAFDKKSLALEAIRVEQDLLGEPVGSQDQTAVAFGGLNRIDFKPDGDLVVTPVNVSLVRREQLERHLMMFFTGFTRDASSIEKVKTQNFSDRRVQMERLYQLVGEGQAVLQQEGRSLNDFGGLLDEAWQQKKSLAKGVSSGPIEKLYEAATEEGAIGGKLLGAGGGGFLLFYVPLDRQEAVRQRLQGMRLEHGDFPVHVPMRLERDGSQTVLFSPDLTANYERRTVPREAFASASANRPAAATYVNGQRPRLVGEQPPS
jgi:D-glycero-alpha-D-manno-heptose-7-phosphate kinase